jgi:hypothetical protein
LRISLADSIFIRPSYDRCLCDNANEVKETRTQFLANSFSFVSSISEWTKLASLDKQVGFRRD